MHEEEFLGDPTQFSDVDWQQLADVVKEHGEVTIYFVVGMPPLGHEYSRRVDARTSARRMNLNRLIEGTVLVAEATRDGGPNAHVGYDIEVQHLNE